MSLIAIIVDVLSWVFILSGSFILVIGALGTMRLPNFWTRLHAASVIDSAAIILLFIGMCLQAGLTLVTVKLIIIGVFLFITGPTATHAAANAALVSGARPKEAEGFTGAEPEPLTKPDPDPDSQE